MFCFPFPKNWWYTESSWLNCALRDDEAVYWVSIEHYEAVAFGNWCYWVSRGHLCLYILQKVEIYTGVANALRTDGLTLKDRATQLLIKYKSGALVTQLSSTQKTIVWPNNCFGELQKLAGRVQNQMADAILPNLQDVTAIFLTFCSSSFRSRALILSCNAHFHNFFWPT